MYMCFISRVLGSFDYYLGGIHNSLSIWHLYKLDLSVYWTNYIRVVSTIQTITKISHHGHPRNECTLEMLNRLLFAFLSPPFFGPFWPR